MFFFGIFMPGCLIRAPSWLQPFGGNIWKKIAAFKTALSTRSLYAVARTTIVDVTAATAAAAVTPYS